MKSKQIVPKVDEARCAEGVGCDAVSKFCGVAETVLPRHHAGSRPHGARCAAGVGGDAVGEFGGVGADGERLRHKRAAFFALGPDAEQRLYSSLRAYPTGRKPLPLTVAEQAASGAADRPPGADHG